MAAIAFDGSRSTRFLVNVTSIAPYAEPLATDRAWSQTVWQALFLYADGSGGYVNFMGDYGPGSGVNCLWSGEVQRLARIKARYDPDNVFRVNANIKPATFRRPPAVGLFSGVIGVEL